MIPPASLPATDDRALVRFLRIFPFRAIFRSSQASIVTQNSNLNSVIAHSSVINNTNFVNNVVQTADEQVSSPIRACRQCTHLLCRRRPSRKLHLVRWYLELIDEDGADIS